MGVGVRVWVRGVGLAAAGGQVAIFSVKGGGSDCSELQSGSLCVERSKRILLQVRVGQSKQQSGMMVV